MKDVGLLILRLITGWLLAGHGSQKLFGWFGGPGLQGTAGWLDSLGMTPAEFWAQSAGVAEFTGGSLTALGFLHPLGPISVLAAMTMAWAKAHRGKPIWVSEGGAELPLTNIGIASALLIAGPGKISLDSIFGSRLPRWMTVLVVLAVVGGIALGINSQASPTPVAGNTAQTAPQGSTAR